MPLHHAVFFFPVSIDFSKFIWVKWVTDESTAICSEK